MDCTKDSKVDTLANMYERMMYDFSYDLHERYSHLLTGVLHQLEQDDSKKGIALLVSHIIEDMRNKSNETTPLSLYRKGLWAALKQVGRQLENRFGVTITFLSTNRCPEISDEEKSVLFRLLQRTLQTIVEIGDTDKIEVRIDMERVTFSFQSEQEYIPNKQKDLFILLEKRTDTQSKLERAGRHWSWTYVMRKGETAE
ncbi:hypothetical protein SAMN04487936_11724 [Halobacillus dabanensis]|uniref:Two-component system, NarL family, sensor histidine kinase NreB n=1 Tax=Halobacillus dabanensis TaxID=240302 RepID=A0A1I4AD58_HALDA|nr:hypothetical protein [Halobacillus dabanensis]SFK54358.1 hypothetical protein SAMN04487936_11724 [Halobacillus dabanensis]